MAASMVKCSIRRMSRLYQVEGDLNVALSAVAAGGPSVEGHRCRRAERRLKSINGDPVLASALAANPLPTTGGVGFQAMPVGDDSPAALTAASQFGASLHQIGTVITPWRTSNSAAIPTTCRRSTRT